MKKTTSIERIYRKDYSFPYGKLKSTLDDPSKTPLVIVACGSFSPITYLHLRMFEMSMDYFQDQRNLKEEFEIIGGYLSPVSDAYGKAGLAAWTHRVNMAELAVKESSWIMVDTWEASHSDYVRTATVLDHFEEHLNGKGLVMPDGSVKRIRIMLVAGGDLIKSFAVPNLWADADASLK